MIKSNKLGAAIISRSDFLYIILFSYEIYALDDAYFSNCMQFYFKILILTVHVLDIF